jgi:hypothetical protein
MRYLHNRSAGKPYGDVLIRSVKEVVAAVASAGVWGVGLGVACHHRCHSLNCIRSKPSNITHHSFVLRSSNNAVGQMFNN